MSDLPSRKPREWLYLGKKMLMNEANELIYEIDAEFSRPVSPSILEHRILELKKELRKAENRTASTEAELGVAYARNRAFENLLSRLAGHIDKLEEILNEMRPDREPYPNLRPVA